MARHLVFALVALAWLSVMVPVASAQPVKASPSSPSAGCQPKEGRNPCESCHERNCCAERRACENDPACTAFLDCLRRGCPAPPCFTACGSAPKTYIARFSCQMEKCNEPACGGPVDACTLCSSTKCVAETIACQVDSGCSAYLSCNQSCQGDSACVARCRKTSTGKESLVEAQETCLRKQCAQVCP